MFLVIEKRFGMLEVVANLDAYQITKNQILQNSFFCCLIFKEFEKEFLNQNFLACCLGRRDQQVYLIFQNHASQGTKVFHSNGSKVE